MTSMLKRVNPLIVVVAVIAILAALIWVIVPHTGKRYVYADFPRTISLYKGSDVKIMGVGVGKVDSVTPQGTFVTVKLSYSAKYHLPADVKAVVISPSIVGDRFVQLTPAYTGGKALPDNAVLHLKRTGTPLELDQIFGSINQLDVALGPKGANAPDQSGTGALTRLLDATARNFGGEGVQFNQTLTNFSKLTKTLADNKDALFGSTREIESFVHTLSKNDTTVRRFSQSLASGSSLLSSDRQVLGEALDNLATALTQVRTFVHSNRALLTSNIAGLRSLSDTIVKRRTALDQSLTYAPTALNDLFLAYDSNTGTLDTRTNVGVNVKDLTTDPVTVLCSLIQSGSTPCPLEGLGGLFGGPSKTSAAQARRGGAVSGSANRVATGRRSRQPVDFDPTLAGLIEVSR